MLRCILCCFEAVSGPKINLAKSELFQIGEVPNLEGLAWILGWKIGVLPSIYLGMPLGARFKSKEVWRLVIDRISARLGSWGAALLSKGGRLTLLKSTLASIPNYYLSLLTIPSSVASVIETRFRNFLWNDLEDHQRFHLVDWKSICRPLGYGGLGIRSIKDHNMVLLAKWLWRFGMENESFWRRMVVARFGEVSCWEAKEVRGRHGRGLWKSIQSVRECFWKFIRYKLGSGREISFWEDKWIGEVPLKVLFRNLFSLAVDPRGKVVDHYDEVGNIWNPCLCRNLNDWEMNELGRLLELLEGSSLNSCLEDSWEWILQKKRKFTPKCLYLELKGFKARSFPQLSIWIPGLPSKVAFSCGMSSWIKFLLLITYKAGGGIWLIDVCYV